MSVGVLMVPPMPLEQGEDLCHLPLARLRRHAKGTVGGEAAQRRLHHERADVRVELLEAPVLDPAGHDPAEQRALLVEEGLEDAVGERRTPPGRDAHAASGDLVVEDPHPRVNVGLELLGRRRLGLDLVDDPGPHRADDVPDRGREDGLLPVGEVVMGVALASWAFSAMSFSRVPRMPLRANISTPASRMRRRFTSLFALIRVQGRRQTGRRHAPRGRQCRRPRAVHKRPARRTAPGTSPFVLASAYPFEPRCRSR